MAHTECWSDWCIADDCDGVEHLDATGATWREARGSVYDPREDRYLGDRWPRLRLDGSLYWACCVSSIGPACQHRSA